MNGATVRGDVKRVASPEPEEAPEYYSKYIKLVPQNDVRIVLRAQLLSLVGTFPRTTRMFVTLRISGAWDRCLAT